MTTQTEKAKDICPGCGGKVMYYHNPGVTRMVCTIKCNGWKVIKKTFHPAKTDREGE